MAGLPLFWLFAFVSTIITTHARIQSDCERRQAESGRSRTLETVLQEHGRLEHGERTLPYPSSCATVNRHQGRHKRDAPELLSPEAEVPQTSGRAVYFSGSPEVLQFKKLGNVSVQAQEEATQPFPRHEFTVAFWVQPEGGQMQPVVLMGLYDKCKSAYVWALGVRAGTGNVERDAAIFFSVHSGRSRQPTLLTSHKRLLPARWSHLAAVYDGRRLHLYVDGGRVATGSDQKGPLFSSATSGCVALMLGGSRDDQKYFRGKMADLLVWGRSLPQREVIEYMHLNPEKRSADDDIYHSETFNTLNNFVTSHDVPRVVDSDVTYQRHSLTLVAPPCGMTLCDDPEVIRSYTGNWRLRTPKTVKYRIINLAEDDGSNPTVSPEQIKRQDRALRAAFSPHNITFRLIEHKVMNTTLRRRVILEKCEPEMVGNGICNCACQHPSTGNDGGDCDDVTADVRSFCTSERIGDGKCDSPCNVRYYDWDGGDCCTNTTSYHSYCRDPFSRHRAYMSLSEYKKLIALPADSHLNIFFANWTNPDLLGIATFPWVRDVHSVMGGAVMQPSVYGAEGRTDNLVHELGHVFGLLHVHHGVSGLACDDPCLESEPSLTLGDLCEDTKPTPVNGYCRDPTEGGASSTTDGVCDMGPFTDTPYRNYMAYTDDDCMDHFTPQQQARMHCYLDLAYQRWQVVPKPSPVPLPPRVVASTSGSVSLRWLPPIGSGRTAIDQICSDCRSDHSLVQFGTAASSDGATSGDTDWTPLQATGPPDAKPCTLSTLSWSPDLHMGSLMLEVSFRYPVVPRRLSIWVIFNASKNIRNIELVFKDGASHHLGPIEAQCDTPYTTSLSMEKLLTKVRIHVRSPLVGIDAVMVESEPAYTGCEVCPKIQYAVTRHPPFTAGRVITDAPYLNDSTVTASINYTYQVQAILGSKRSEVSPTLHYTHGHPYCGDGHVNSATEQCDDGNVMGGDGCDVSCQTEDFYRCQGEPSVCVHHQGDGVCEDFERRSVLSDCGYFTPDGATDQWAIDAHANPEHDMTSCPASAVVGQPAYDVAKTCQMHFFHPELVWSPCGHSFMTSDFWIEAFFAKPVVATAVVVYAHLLSFGAPLSQNNTLHINLIDVNNVTRQTGSDVTFTCDFQPITFDVHHNLNRDFFLTKGVRLSFRSYRIGISGIALRTRQAVSHQAAASCTTEELYNPHTGSCVPYSCERPLCEDYVIKHGNATCTGSRDGDRCHVICSMGYQVTGGDTTAVCVQSTWTGALKCEPVTCGPPTIPHAKLDCPDGHVFGKKCKFECKRPARKIGTGNMVVCEDDGIWSLPEAFCQMMCAASPVVKNASLTTRRCSNEQNVGDKCRYKCHKGYHVVGQPLGRRVLWYTCTEAGLWLGPTCERVHCPQVDPILHGLYSCTQSHYAGSTCTLKCPGPTRVTSSITCQQDGQWDAEFTKCKFEPEDCPDPSTNDLITVSCQTMSIGSRCRVFCNNSDFEPVLQRRNHHGNFGSHGNALHHVTCTGQRLWYPDIDDITCVERCIESQIGDGVCQPENNRGHCGWDGGDCCPSTTPGGVVVPAHDTCTSGCLCKDPGATEQLLSDARYRPSHEARYRPILGRNYFHNYFIPRANALDLEDEELAKKNGTPLD